MPKLPPLFVSAYPLADAPEIRLPPLYSGRSCWNAKQQVLVIDVSPLCDGPTLVCLTGWQRGIQGCIWRDGQLESYDDPLQFDWFPVEFFAHTLMRGWVDTIPAEVITRLQHYSSHALGILNIICRDSAAYELFMDHPTLFWLLFRQVRQQGCGLGRLLAYCRLKRTEIARICGFPDTPSFVKLLKKLTVSRFTQRHVDWINETLSLNPIRLNHLTVLPESLWSCLLRYPVLLESPLVQHWQEADAVRLNISLREFNRMRSFKHVPFAKLVTDLKRCHTVSQVIKCQRRWEAKLLAKDYVAIPLPFPAPPLPGNSQVIPITSYAELEQEGETMQHCVEGFYTDIIDGHYYVYQVVAPERATLSIQIRHQPTGQTTLRIDQLRGPYNRPVSAETLQAVKTWFNRQPESGVLS